MQLPHGHYDTDTIPESSPEKGLDSNYCRNPDGGDTIWCYTTNPDEKWDYCDPIGKTNFLSAENALCLE